MDTSPHLLKRREVLITLIEGAKAELSSNLIDAKGLLIDLAVWYEESRQIEQILLIEMMK
jgi:hypothetical protein